MKWALIGVLTLGALGSWAMSVASAGSLSADVKPMPLPRVVMRPLPALSGSPVEVAMAPKAAAKPEPKDDLEALPPAPKAEAKPEPKAEPKPEPVAAKAEPKPEPKAEPKPEPKAETKVAKADPAPAPKPAAQPKPAPEEGAAPAPKPKPAPEEKEEKVANEKPAPAAAPAGEGFVNLKASDTAEIVIDGRKVGPSPKLGHKLKAGKHKIRFDCYDENGNLKPGKIQNVEILPDEEKDIEYECPFAQ